LGQDLVHKILRTLKKDKNKFEEDGISKTEESIPKPHTSILSTPKFRNQLSIQYN